MKNHSKILLIGVFLGIGNCVGHPEIGVGIFEGGMKKFQETLDKSLNSENSYPLVEKNFSQKIFDFAFSLNEYRIYCLLIGTTTTAIYLSQLKIGTAVLMAGCHGMGYWLSLHYSNKY